MRFIRALSCVSTCLFLGTVTFAATPKTHDDLLAEAQNYVLSHLHLQGDETAEVKVLTANVPANFPECPQNYQFELPRDISTTQPSSVLMTCAAKNWKMYLPLEVAIYTNVIVAKRLLTAQDIIGPDDVELQPYQKNRLYQGYFVNAADVYGQSVNHMMIAGSVLTRNSLKQQLVIRRNQLVRVVARKNGIEVSTRGIAKSDGALHDVIKIYNPASKRTVDAIINSATEAEVVA